MPTPVLCIFSISPEQAFCPSAHGNVHECFFIFLSIISGVNPVTAIGYQIAILLGITGAVALSVILFTQLGCKTYFNERMQLKE
ncbi:ABC transporter permease [Marinococcus sp. PL1-022]|uniref:ABC transporter permease n=1 Tax=Marinococcus sp. PL1-022 TaxID=3095363 RepID=UPI0039B585C3